ncbi:ABC transporter permease [Chryseosolibacter indicus]|uniref:ABC transporter permease n=1 Tax=Chryseosolibacter indicus TaxID=2782351 RepID=A0ABS5VQS6_9BACT|nr:ABC transporter permease [Chryseosolibacter indicus]MBT1703800.1 ABC transporter permease [Chryseosolibacter indicus]
MLKNFFTLALRNLLKRKLYSFINIFGLAIGVAVCLVILKYVDFELSYDRFHKKAETIYRNTTTYFQNGELRGTNVVSGYALGPSLASDIPEVKTYVRTHPMYGGAVAAYKRNEGDPSIFQEDNMQFADSTFFDVFTYEALQGNLNTALDNPNSVVITKETATKYFGKEDPLGKTFQISGGWADGDYEVTAVLKEVPQNSHFDFDFLFPIHNLLKGEQYQQDKDGWGWNNFITYVQFHDRIDIKSVEAKIPAFVEKYRGKELAESNGKVVFNFQPILDIHLSPGLDLESSPTVSINSIYFFIIISVFILAIAWINYINLSTARAMERAREVGIKKAVGAVKGQLVWQFISESVLVNLLGVVLAVLIALALLPVLGEIVNKNLRFDFADYRFWLILFGLFVTGSLISGAYPAFVLSSFNTTQVLKGKVENLTSGFSLRKALVVFQFASSLILIAGTFTIYRQVIFMRSQDKGLTMEQMLIVDGPKVVDWKTGKERRARLTTFKNQLAEVPGVRKVATSASIPGGGYNWGTSMRRDGAPREENKGGSVVWVDPDFIETYGIKILSGRNFNPAIRSDMESVLVNEAALKSFGLGDAEHALQERIVLGGDTVAILGVLKNYHWNSLKIEHSPWLLKADTIAGRNYSIHLESKNMPETISKVEALFKEAFPGNPFNYYFLDDFFNKQYKDEQQFAKIFSLFAVLAIIIACLGLWGLASFTTTLKLKEIGIRKVLGASTRSIMSLLSWQFFKLVLIACLISIPLTWYGVDQWLGTFAFRIGIQWDLFVVPIVILSVIALGTVSLQILRGANINPAKILRSE